MMTAHDGADDRATDATVGAAASRSPRMPAYPRTGTIPLPGRVHQGPAVVALGGGHGLSVTLQALRHLTRRLTAVVTVADDGGSSGRLRHELGVLPPGDLRMALAALCEDDDWGTTWRDVLQHRFTSDGPLDYHAVGNLLIAALWDRYGDTVGGLDLVGELLHARGRVLPMCSVPLDIEADVTIGGVPQVVHGQSKVAVTQGIVRQVRLLPHDPPACVEAVAAVDAADWVVLGPGSWFTSVLPHLLVPELSAALHATQARRALTLNLSAPAGETAGLSAADHVRTLTAHAPDLRIDVVLADPAAVEDVDELAAAAADAGGTLLLRQVSLGDGTARHDPLRLAAALRDSFSGTISDVRRAEPGR